MSGLIVKLDQHTFVVAGDDGRRYFAYRRHLDSFGLQFADLKISMRVIFTPVESFRSRDDPRAIEIRVIDATTLDGR